MKHEAAAELASSFEMMMQQLLLLGHTLPSSATSLTPQQLKLLFTLDFLGAPTPMTKLSLQLGVTPGTLTKGATALISSDYLEKRRSESDERVVNICLTRSGKALVDDIRSYRLTFFRGICEKLKGVEVQALISSHRTIFETYRKVLADTNGELE